MTVESNTGLNVNNHYNARELQDGLLAGGKLAVDGSIDEIVIYVKGTDFGTGTSFVPGGNPVLPAGSIVREVITEVIEAFVRGGTTPTINVGTVGSEGTNFADELSEAQAEAVATYDGTTGGTYSAPLAADSLIGVALDGSTPTVTSAGSLKMVIRFSKI